MRDHRIFRELPRKRFHYGGGLVALGEADPIVDDPWMGAILGTAQVRRELPHTRKFDKCETVRPEKNALRASSADLLTLRPPAQGVLAQFA